MKKMQKPFEKLQYTMKKEFLERLQNQISSDRYESFLENIEKEINYSYQYHPIKSKQKKGQKIPWAKNAYFQTTKPSYAQDPLFHAGTYYVQEASSMVLEAFYNSFLSAYKNLKVLDLCAAPGGKSLHLLSLMNSEGMLVSNEPIKSRIPSLKENGMKWGFANHIIISEDPSKIALLENYFDVLLIDAPCSGEGMFRKDMASQNQWSVENAKMCSLRQKRILDAAWSSLKPGGYMLYSTCTFNPDENENLLQDFLGKNNATSLELKDLDPEWKLEEIKKENAFFYRFLIGESLGEGFFISMIKKEGELMPNHVLSSNQNVHEKMKNWIKDDQLDIVLKDDKYIVQSRFLSQEENFLRKHFKLISCGVWYASKKNEEIIPEHASAMSIDINQNFLKTIELNLGEAIAYLKKETINTEATDKGWYLMLYQNTALGWAKWLGNRWNNYYPTEWRLRK